MSAVSWLTAAMFLVEMAVIAGQVVRNTSSHFNFTTPLDAMLFNIMGAGITIVWILGAIVAVVLIVQGHQGSPFLLSLRFGLLLSLLGMAVAFLMTPANPAQAEASLAASRTAGDGRVILGAHAVGVPDGGPGLPVLGWSTEGGDLRAPHFVGLHALQALPIVAWLLSRSGLPLARLRIAVWAAGAWYLGLVLLLTGQALRGQSIVAPDWPTIAAFLGGTLLAAGTAVLLPTDKSARHAIGSV